MLSLVVLSNSCMVLTNMSSVVCVFGLVDIRCTFGKAKNVTSVDFTGNSSKICFLLLGDMLLMMSLDSSLCFFIISDEDSWNVLLSVKVRLQSYIYSLPC